MIDRNFLAVGTQPTQLDRLIRPRSRVIIDNDFSGDVDDLFQLVHHVLSPSVEIPLIIGSHISVGDTWDSATNQAEKAAYRALELLRIMTLEEEYRVLAGSNNGLENARTPMENEASQAIITEALRDDTNLPLFIACGAGLTELASAWLIEPRIAERLTAIWIGGPGYADLGAKPPFTESLEYNQAIDPIAAQIVFNDSDIPIWQVPRNVYRQFLMSYTELRTRIRPYGALGKLLSDSVEDVMRWQRRRKPPGIGETYVMGDSPLVTLTALQSAFDADPSSSEYVVRRAPRLDNQGRYVENTNGREIRVYTHCDTRMTFEDLFLKIQAFAEALS